MKLEAVCTLIVDAEHKTAPRVNEGFPSIRTPNIGKGRLNLEGVYRVSKETYIKWTRRAIPQANDLILAREAPIGNVAIIPDNLSPCLGQRTVLIRPDTEKIDPHFLCYYLLSNEIQNKMTGLSSGATVAHLNMKDIRELELTFIPKLKTQEKIANILSNYDNLIENNQRRINLLEQAAQNIYKEWFVKMRFPGHQSTAFNEQTGHPKGWTMKELYDVFSIKYGKNLPKTQIKDVGGYPVYGASGIIGYYTLANTHLKAALITSRGNGSGDVHRTFHSKAFVTNNSFVVTPKEQYSFIPLSYTTELLNTLNLKNYCSGSAQPQLTNAAMKNITFVFPEPALIKAFSEIVSPILSQCDLLRKQNHKLNEAKDILLPRLMNQTIKV